jgi:PST family polysaccharide transporter
VNQTQPAGLANSSETEALRQNLRTRSVRGAMYLAAGSAGDMVLRVVSTAILARLLVPEHFGLLGMVTAVTAIAQQISQLGLSAATVQRKDIAHEQVTSLFWVNVAFGALLTLMLIAVAPWVAAFYRDPRLSAITIAVATSFLWGGLTVQHEALLTRQMKQAETSMVRLAASFLSIAVAIALALEGFGYWALVWREVVRAFLVAVGMWILCPWLPGLPARGAGVRSLLKFGRDVTISQFLNALVSNLDRFLIGRFFGPASVGVYQQAQQLVMAPIEQLNGPILGVSQPGLSLLQDNPERYRRYYRKIVSTVALATMPLAAFLVVYAEEVTLVLLGRNWIEAAWLLRVFAVSAFIRPALGTSAVVLMTRGLSGKILKFSLVRNTTLVIFTIIGVRWGASGVAVAQMANTLALTLPCLFYSFSQSPVTVDTFWKAVRPSAIASVVMALGLAFLRAAMTLAWLPATLALASLVGGLLFFVVYVAVPGGRSELNELRSDVLAALPKLRGDRSAATASA